MSSPWTLEAFGGPREGDCCWFDEQEAKERTRKELMDATTANRATSSILSYLTIPADGGHPWQGLGIDTMMCP